MKKNIISMAAAMAVLSACGPGVPQLGKSSLDEVIGAMTLEEKAHLVVGTGMAGFLSFRLRSFLYHFCLRQGCCQGRQRCLYRVCRSEEHR